MPNDQGNTASAATGSPSRAPAAALLGAILLLNLAASIAFKEGGTDAARRWFWFIGGNALGISATALMMMLYRRMCANLAVVIITGVSGVLVQLVFWRLYHAPLTALQVAGIAITLVGTVVATGTGSKEAPAPAAEGMA